MVKFKPALLAVSAAAALLALLIGWPGLWGNHVRLEETDELLIVGTSAYEAAFYRDNGGIAYIREKNTGGRLSAGNRERQLWWAFMTDAASVKAGDSAEAAAFAYSWNRSARMLTFRYGASPGIADPVEVEVTADFSAEGRLTLQASVWNRSDRIVESFRFPYELRFDVDELRDGLLPMMPGAKLAQAFFTEHNSFEGQYPGVMFAAYIGVSSRNGTMAVYDVNEGGAPIASVDIGFKSQVDDAGKSAVVHHYKTWIGPDGRWTSPLVVIEIGGGYADSIAAYRTLNRIDAYRPLDEKLGEERQRYFQSPLYKLDIAAIGRENWRTLAARYADPLDHAGILHLVGFQEGGHDENYPDFLPPADRWGGMADFLAFVSSVRDSGHKVVPYTNFSWWGVSSPTLAGLPDGLTLADIAVNRENGSVIKEDYGPHSGYVMNPAHPFVRARIAEEHERLVAGAGFDGVFEDQWGARNAPYMFNAEAPAGADPSSAYFEGVRQYLATVKHKSFQEVGIDVLADNSAGFLGTNYLWDLLGYRSKTDRYTDYYPMAGMLLRDKVLMYQHNLAAETMTAGKEMLRWNMAMGYQLSGDLLNGTANPWLDVAGVFQKHLLARYAGERVGGYEQLGDRATRTTIGDYAITANWDGEAGLPLAGAGHMIAPAGVDAVSEDGTVRGGIYTRYNGADLDPGDHYLVEVREPDHIDLYQPVGADTTVRIRKGEAWPHAIASAHRHDGTPIAELPVTEEADGYAVFDYIGRIYEQEVGYVRVSRSEAASRVGAVPFAKQPPRINLALGRPIVSTTDTAEAFPATAANDGDRYTYWESMPGRFPQSITVDLGEAIEVAAVSLSLPPLDAWEARDQEIAVLASDDGENFRPLVASRSYMFDPASANALEIPLGEAKARFIRLTIAGNTGWPAGQISEFEVY